MAHWLVGLVAALQLVSFATPFSAQAAVESVPPISGGTVWRASWKGGSFPSAVAACSSLSPSDCPICGSLSYVGTKPNPAYPDYMDCVVFYNPGDGTPGWNTLSGTAIPRVNAVCPVPTVNPTAPYQYKVSSGMCEREAPCLAPNAINPRTGQCEPAQKLIITLSGDNEVEPSDASSPKTLPFRATVIDQNTNQPPPNPVTVKIALKVDSATGGHDHGGSTRPRGGIANVGTCPSDAECWSSPTVNGGVVFNFNVPEASGTHTITATCDGCSNTATKTVDVKVVGLEVTPSSPFYVFIGETDKHTDNHYLTPEAAAVLWRIAVSYQVEQQFKLQDPATGKFTVTPPVLHVNDASLKWGGKFDLSGRWAGPHYEHRRGTVIDIRANTQETAIPDVNFDKYILLADRYCVDALLEEPDINRRHFHLRLLNREE